MAESKGRFYITTPIYYPSDNLHIGHTYCTVMADAMARFKRATGYEVRFMTGTDEHGQKIQKKAQEAGKTPKEFVDEIVSNTKKLWETMEISYDKFIRTTDEDHCRRVQEIFMEMYNNGDIYKGKYEGWYCTPCESFWTEKELVDGKCPDCGREVEWASEDAYFFRLSKYQDAILKNFKENPDFLQPETRRNEMIAFVEKGLDDLCISRSSFDWGIPVPIDEKHVIYVWLDALTNYITALGYPDDKELYEKWWPADVQLVGKEIVRFHTVIWPAMLMSIHQPLPKKVMGHGWILIDGGKMSKSKGNVVDPVMLINRYGVDAVKYFLLREYAFGQDGNFTNEIMIKRMNNDLSNDLGNLVRRTVSMIERYCEGGRVPDPKEPTEFDEDLKAVAIGAADKVEAAMDDFKFNVALEEIWKVIDRANKYIDETRPWILSQEEESRDTLDTVLYNLADTLRIVSILLVPFMETTSKKIRKQLGLWYTDPQWDDAKKFGLMKGETARKGEQLFPRLDIKKELEELENLKKPRDQQNIPLKLKPEITIDDFNKLDLRVGLVEKCEKHPKADNLLVFQIKMDTERRTIVSGVADCYKPEDLVGKKVTVVANLKPRMLRGIESNGMLMFAENKKADGSVRWEYLTSDAPDGSPIS